MLVSKIVVYINTISKILATGLEPSTVRLYLHD